MRFELTWGASDEEVTHLERAEGLTSGDLEELSELLPDGRFEVAAGSVGKGAAGYGVALLIDVERAVADLASLAAIGGLLWKIIDRISRKRRHRPTVHDGRTLAALGAGSLGPGLAPAAAGCRYVGTVPITATAGVGTDDRDIWAACFSCDVTSSGLVIFLSPSGTCLGSVSVPAEMYMDGKAWRSRSAGEITKWWQREAGGNRPSNGS